MNALEQLREDQRLGSAWRRCEAALPKGWALDGLRRFYDNGRWPGGWVARAVDLTQPPVFRTDSDYAELPVAALRDDNPTAALEALAEALEAHRVAEE